MGFDRGAVSFRMFYLPGGLPVDYVDRFAAHAAPDLAALGRDPQHGWVTHRHLLDRNINEESAHLAGYLFLTLMKAERRVPAALLNAEFRMDELARLQADGKQFLNRKERMELRRETHDRLFPAMPPILSGIQVTYDPASRLLLAAALSDKQADAFMLGIRETLGVMPVAVTPEAAALQRLQVNARDISPTSFSAECPDADAGDKLGYDFLTWLWYFSEQEGGQLAVDGTGLTGVMLEGPLLFVREECAGANEALLRKGLPLIAAEGRTALLGGKKLAVAVINFVTGDSVWRGTVAAADFRFRSWRLPQGDAVDPAGRFQERMLAMQSLQNIWWTYFDAFIKLRASGAAWRRVRDKIRSWVAERQVKA